MGPVYKTLLAATKYFNIFLYAYLYVFSCLAAIFLHEEMGLAVITILVFMNLIRNRLTLHMNVQDISIKARLDLDRLVFMRMGQSLVDTNSPIKEFNFEETYNKLYADAAQLVSSDQAVWPSYAKLANDFDEATKQKMNWVLKNVWLLNLILNLAPFALFFLSRLIFKGVIL